MTRNRIAALLLAWSTAVSVSAFAGTIPVITGDVVTEFGTYSPVVVKVSPAVPYYEIADDLSNVINAGDFELTPEAVELLKENGFAAEAASYSQIYDVYHECKEMGIPAFVTTDACLHAYHILYDYILRVVETEYFIDDLCRLTEAMIEETKAAHDEASEQAVKDAALVNLAYLSVAGKLLMPEMEVDERVAEVVSLEVGNIMELSRGYIASPLFYSEDYPYLEDYSQYKPRGHYTRTPDLERYFRAMMWYGRITFSLTLQFSTEEGIRRTAVQALLLCHTLENTDVGGETVQPAKTVWGRIYDPTVFFVGKTDDIDHNAYIDLAVDHFGKSFTTLSPDILAQSEKVDAFIQDALELPDPKITVKAGKGYRFMGQRFVPDSYILDQMVDEFVLGRFMPRGLDVMIVFGSDRAYEIVDTYYNDPAMYALYDPQIAKLKEEFGTYSPEVWAQNLYYNWLYVLAPLLEVKDEGYPVFMQNEAWVDKSLNTVLGSWAELRHDTILYVKQSETFERAPNRPPFIMGYVEPEPEVFARLEALASFMRRGLDGQGLLSGLFEGRLIDFETLMDNLKTIAVKELENTTPTDEEFAHICNFGVTLEALTTFPPEFEEKYENDADKFMAVIADVHTDPNFNECLEVGVGHPLTLYVIALVNGVPTLTKGSMFSYHEFKRSLADERLTDEEWQELQSGQDAVSMPEWSESFLAGESSQKRETYNYPSDSMIVTSVDEEAREPAAFSLLQNSPNPFNPSTTINFSLEKSGRITLSVYNLSGQLVARLVDEWRDAGAHSVRWAPENLSSGIYFVRLKSGGKANTVKMVFMK